MCFSRTAFISRQARFCSTSPAWRGNRFPHGDGETRFWSLVLVPVSRPKGSEAIKTLWLTFHPSSRPCVYHLSLLPGGLLEYYLRVFAVSRARTANLSHTWHNRPNPLGNRAYSLRILDPRAQFRGICRFRGIRPARIRTIRSNRSVARPYLPSSCPEPRRPGTMQ